MSGDSQRTVNGSIQVPEGMSKSAFKKQLKRERFENTREEWVAQRRIKRKIDKKRQRENRRALGITRSPIAPSGAKDVDVDVILDCDFVEYMKDGELTSLSRQLELCYSQNRRSMHRVRMHLNSVHSQLAERFNDAMQGNQLRWKDVEVTHRPFEPNTDGTMIYLSSDSDVVIDDLKPGHTYIIGGIVDKGRHKNLCHSKAQKLGIPTARLPIDENIKLGGRRVLTTNHVFELLLKWFEVEDWKAAFEAVLPSRKLLESDEATAKHEEHMPAESDSPNVKNTDNEASGVKDAADTPHE